MITYRPFNRIKTGLIVVKDTFLGEIQRQFHMPISHTGIPRLALEEWLQHLGNPPPVKARFLVTALRNRFWIYTNIYIACVLRSMGYASTVVYRGSQVGRLVGGVKSDFHFWPAVSRIPDIEVIDLETIPANPQGIESLMALAQEWAPLTVAYDEHVEEADVRDQRDRYAARIQFRVESSVHLAASLEGVLRQRNFDRFICQSGLIEETPLLLAVARRQQLCTVCLESWAWRPGHLIFNLNAPALEYDARLWMKAEEPWDAFKDKEIRQYLSLVDGDYEGGSDWLDNFQRIQQARLAGGLSQPLQKFLQGSEPVFIAPTNVIGDSSMHRRETIFAGQQDWIRRLLGFFSDHPELKLVIRAHPAELRVQSKVRVRMGDFAKQHAYGQTNVFVIGPEEPINTFALLSFARGGLVWISSAGAEMVARGLPVMAAARPKYAGLDIVSEPTSKSEYWIELERLALSPSKPSPRQKESALRYLHTIFKGFSYEVTGRRAGGGITTNWLMKKQRQLSNHHDFFQLITGESPLPWQRIS